MSVTETVENERQWGFVALRPDFGEDGKMVMNEQGRIVKIPEIHRFKEVDGGLRIVRLQFHPDHIDTPGLGDLTEGQGVTFVERRARRGSFALEIERIPVRETKPWREFSAEIFSQNGRSGWILAWVTFWHYEKKYGFAKTADGRRFFFHLDSVVRRCHKDYSGFQEDDEVYLVPEAASLTDSRGPRAARVICLEDDIQ